jgi:hypothetical protein
LIGKDFADWWMHAGSHWRDSDTASRRATVMLTTKTGLPFKKRYFAELVASVLAPTLLSGISGGFRFGVSPVLPQRVQERANDHTENYQAGSGCSQAQRLRVHRLG